jgi:uncharacterized DUF497 family protein
MEFRWNDWNLDHATKHGCTIAEIESVVRRPGRGYPRKWGDEKWRVEGRGQGDRPMEVVYLIDPDDTIYVIHAMPLTTRRRRGRR